MVQRCWDASCMLWCRGQDWDLPLQCCLEGSTGQGTALGKSVLSHPPGAAEVTTAESAWSAVCPPSSGGQTAFSCFSSHAPIWNPADLFKNCFVKVIIQKGIIQFSIDAFYKEFIKAAWLYQSDRAGCRRLEGHRFMKQNTTSSEFLCCQHAPTVTGVVISGSSKKSANKRGWLKEAQKHQFLLSGLNLALQHFQGVIIAQGISVT